MRQSYSGTDAEKMEGDWKEEKKSSPMRSRTKHERSDVGQLCSTRTALSRGAYRLLRHPGSMTIGLSALNDGPRLLTLIFLSILHLNHLELCATFPSPRQPFPSSRSAPIPPGAEVSSSSSEHTLSPDELLLNIRLSSISYYLLLSSEPPVRVMDVSGRHAWFFVPPFSPLSLRPSYFLPNIGLSFDKCYAPIQALATHQSSSTSRAFFGPMDRPFQIPSLARVRRSINSQNCTRTIKSSSRHLGRINVNVKAYV